jgi:hypothetical protein
MINRLYNLPLFKRIEANKIFYKIILILFLGVLFYSIPKDYLGEKYPICLYRILFNKKCIGCGTTRALWSIIHFKFSDAIEYNRLIIITFPLLTGCVIHWVLRKKKTDRFIP